jgi:two-component system CheB/CheR fusion protein
MAERKQARQRTTAKRARQTPSAKQPRSRARRASSTDSNVPHTTPFIVAIGASAGGLEALIEFFDHMPADSGIAFVVVTHRSPEHASLQPSLLQRHTAMPVREVTDGMQVQPNMVSLAPPMGKLALLNGIFRVMDAGEHDTMRLPIDYFLRMLAEDQEEGAICVILSGTGTDGTLGLKAVKARGGLALVQDPATAKYAGMPQSALATGLVDFVLAPRDIPEQLLAYTRNEPLRAVPNSHDDGTFLAAVLPKIFVLLRERTGNDFSSYKISTIRRRVERRMKVHRVDMPTEYLRFLQETPHELDLLFKELLISVTQFFRDPEAFAVLGEKILPQMLANRAPEESIRVWVPGCATGEEAYSLAIILQEVMDRINKHCSVQIFATDLDDQAITVARMGQYPEGIAADVSAARLARFFIKEDNLYRVRKDIREMVVFAVQNLLKDPPFTKLNLVSCRNLLIYLDNSVQKQLMPLFHYVQKPNGILFLGLSETIGTFTDHFDVIDKKWKLFQRKEVSTTLHPVTNFVTLADMVPLTSGSSPNFAAGHNEVALAPRIEQLLLSTYVPPSVVVTDRGEVVYVHGRTGHYLELAPGLRNRNILDMAREGLRHELAFAIQQAAAHDDVTVRRSVHVKANGDTINVKLTVKKILDPEPMRGLLLVVFETEAAEESLPAQRPASASRSRQRSRAAGLEQELAYTQAHLQRTVEELETANEELRATNEEVQSTNEELQSSNEELETSREEMQSLNEELQTVNAELQSKVEEFSQANNDMQNLLNSTNVATIFLDSALCIKRFTRQVTRVVKLIDSDVGRPLSDLANNLNYANLLADAKEVLQTLVFKEAEVCTTEGTWFLMRLMPYRTTENMIDGLVITFVDISKLKATERLVSEQHYASYIMQVLREPLLVLDTELRVIAATQRFYNMFQLRPGQVENQLLYELDHGQWNIPALRQLFETTLPKNSVCNDFEVDHTFPGVGRKVMLLNARYLEGKANQSGRILVAIEDVTEHHRQR